MNPLWHPALSGLGFVCGFALAFVLVLVWMAVAGPLQEWLCEVTLDRLRARSAGVTGQVEGKFSVLVSDLHIDTWHTLTDDKCERFHEFLAWIEGEPLIRDLYINGDLLDSPPHPLNQPVVPVLRVQPGEANPYPDVDPLNPLGILNPVYDDVLEALSRLKKPITYLNGNHDIGLYGLRFVRPGLSWTAFSVAWNPSVLIESPSGRRVYAEHGHLRDPFLWLYLRYAALELLQGPARAQGASKVGKGKNSASRSMAVAEPAGPLYFEVAGDVEPPPDEGFFTRLARYRFRQSARRLFRQVNVAERECVKVVTMGHTHLPDRYLFPGDRLYVNSGDWAGNDYHRCFLLIHPDGAVSGPHQWRGALDLGAV